MKQKLSLVLALLMLLPAFTACAESKENTEETSTLANTPTAEEVVEEVVVVETAPQTFDMGIIAAAAAVVSAAGYAITKKRK